MKYSIRIGRQQHTTPPPLFLWNSLAHTGQNGDETICRSQNSSTKLTILPRAREAFKSTPYNPKGRRSRNLDRIYIPEWLLCTTPQKLRFRNQINMVMVDFDVSSLLFCSSWMDNFSSRLVLLLNGAMVKSGNRVLLLVYTLHTRSLEHKLRRDQKFT